MVLSTPPSLTTRACSSGAIRPSPGDAGAPAVPPDPRGQLIGSPFAMAAAGSTWRGPSSSSGQSAHQPGDRQPRLDAPLRRAPGLNAERLRHPEQSAHHPELLDDLAARLHASGLVAQGAPSPDHAVEHLSAGQHRPARVPKVDPENRLLWRFNRRRLDLEAMRDTLLLVRAGSIDHGRPCRWTSSATPENRGGRSTDWLTGRAFPAIFRAFDFASPDQSAERRPSDDWCPSRPSSA